MPVLETSRLYIRPFQPDDLQATAGFREYPEPERKDLLAWSIAENKLLARLHQPPYGDRAVELKSTGQLVGATGLLQVVGVLKTRPATQDRICYNRITGGFHPIKPGILATTETPGETVTKRGAGRI